MTPKFERPRRFEIYRANLRDVGDLHVLVLSDDIANALRSVVIACSLDPVTKEMDLRLPTYALLSLEDTGLESDVVASPASPFTLPKSALVDRLSALGRKAQVRVDAAIRLAFGYEEWPM